MAAGRAPGRAAQARQDPRRPGAPQPGAADPGRVRHSRPPGRPASSASSVSRSAPPGRCTRSPTRSAATPGAVWTRPRTSPPSWTGTRRPSAWTDDADRQVTSRVLTALLGRLAATTDDTQTVRVLAAADLQKDNAFYYAHLDSAERLTAALRQVNWQVLEDLAAAGDDVDQALIISALRQAARRDEHEIALAAPLRKAGDEAIALLRQRARKPAPIRSSSRRTAGRSRYAAPDPGAPVVECSRPERPCPSASPVPSGSGPGTWRRSSNGSARRRTSTRTRSSRLTGGSWSPDGARRQQIGRRA